MAIDPKYRRKGLARKMLAVAERVCRERGRTELALHVTQANTPARTLYEAQGFSELARESPAAKFWGQEPRALMRKAL